MLDTNAAIAVLDNKPARVGDTLVQRLEAGDSVAISSIVLFELWYGISRSTRKAHNAARLAEFLQGAIETFPFMDEDARVAGEIRAALRAAGAPIGPYDVLIAGQALRHGATLVTANVREFASVPGLKVEDWGSPI